MGKGSRIQWTQHTWNQVVGVVTCIEDVQLMVKN